jgi:DNA-binding NtrC family response regulator
MPKILVVDDDRAVLSLVQAACKPLTGYEVLTARSGQSGLALAQDQGLDVVLLDLHLPEMSGFELFQKIRSLSPSTPIIFITSDGSSEVIIKAMRLGAFDYLKKPLQIDQLRRMVSSAASARRIADEPVALSVGSATDQQVFIGNSPTMLEVFKLIGRVAQQKVPVLIRGESGSGKELVARALVDFGGRAEQPFASLNCAAIPDTLLESELFGHEKGSFTGADKRRVGRFEQCDGGTIFLDEIGDMSLAIQGKVLRLLQEQAFERLGGSEVIRTNVRIIAATHQPLEQMVEEGRFRQDLLFRLNGFTIELPPLRERISDIPALAEHFLRRAKSEMERDDVLGISQDALDALMSYDWPGNVRELQSVIRQSVLVCPTKVITLNHLPETVRQSDGSDSLSCESERDSGESDSASADTTRAPIFTHVHSAHRHEQAVLSEGGDVLSISDFVNQRYKAGSKNIYAEMIEEVERRLLTQVLILTDGNQSKASEMLGITRGKIRDRIVAYGIKLDTTVSVD